MRGDDKSLKYSPWEDYGTTFAIKKDNVLEMVTALAEGKPRFDTHIFSLTCGPRQPLTNVIVVYDRLHPAPAKTIRAWEESPTTLR